ncbi:hypothetical protein ACFQX7_02395 [Luedemannella flava]
MVLLVVVGVTALLVWSLIAARGAVGARIAAVVGLVGVLAAGRVGQDMISTGDAVTQATGHVPDGVVFGAAGGAKLVHAVGMHGLQVLIALVVLLALGDLAARTKRLVMWLAAAGYAVFFASVTSTAYAGRAWTDVTTPEAVTGVAGLAAVGAGVAVAAWPLVRGRRGDAVPTGGAGVDTLAAAVVR